VGVVHTVYIYSRRFGQTRQNSRHGFHALPQALGTWVQTSKDTVFTSDPLFGRIFTIILLINKAKNTQKKDENEAKMGLKVLEHEIPRFYISLEY
jgi:hypothetical protein